jgi:hypothetical protein
MGDASPALGYVDNLRLTDGDATLVGDLVGVPAAVAKLLPFSYPDRSIEAELDYVGPDGTTWPMVLCALALIGAAAPAVSTLKSLQDVADLYDIAAAAGRRVTIAASAFHPEDLDARRQRALAVAAARRRRTYRTIGV